MSGQEVRASASLASIFALRMLGLFLILPVFSVHARSIPGGDNPALVGLALGIYGLTQGVLQIPFGAASDRWGRKPVIVAGLLLFAVGSFVAAFARRHLLDDHRPRGAGRRCDFRGRDRVHRRRDARGTPDQGDGDGWRLDRTDLRGVTGRRAAAVRRRRHGRAVRADRILALIAIAVVTWVVPGAPARIQHDDPATPSSVVFDPQLLRLNFGIFALHTVQMAMFVVVPVLLVERAQLPLPQPLVGLPAGGAGVVRPDDAADHRGGAEVAHARRCSCRPSACFSSSSSA